MTETADKKLGRPQGARGQKTLLKSRADDALALLEGMMQNQNAPPELRIAAASAILSTHFQSR